jgi:hypothetical protein
MGAAFAWAMAEAVSAHQAATATREDTSQQRAGRTRRTSADPQRAQQGTTAAAAAAPAALASLSRLQHLADASPQVAQLRRLQALADGHYAPMAQLAGGPEEQELIVGKFAIAELQPQLQQAPRANNTGLPDQLKSGIESLSGLSMDDVRVHYNSSQPAQLNALAYAQGSDIHLAPGQERHLPHEAWHVVQQAQGRVRPTLQLKDGVPVNDDVGLEREADVMGARAAAQRVAAPRRPALSSPIAPNAKLPAIVNYRGAVQRATLRINKTFNNTPDSRNAARLGLGEVLPLTSAASGPDHVDQGSGVAEYAKESGSGTLEIHIRRAGGRSEVHAEHMKPGKTPDRGTDARSGTPAAQSAGSAHGAPATAVHSSPRLKAQRRRIESSFGPDPVQRVRTPVFVTGITHLVKPQGDSIYEGNEGDEIEETPAVIDSDDSILSRRGPNQEEFGAVDRTGPQHYEWFRVISVGGVDKEDANYLREDTFEPSNEVDVSSKQDRVEMFNTLKRMYPKVAEDQAGKKWLGKLIYIETNKVQVGHYTHALFTTRIVNYLAARAHTVEADDRGEALELQAAERIGGVRGNAKTGGQDLQWRAIPAASMESVKAAYGKVALDDLMIAIKDNPSKLGNDLNVISTPIDAYSLDNRKLAIAGGQAKFKKSDSAALEETALVRIDQLNKVCDALGFTAVLVFGGLTPKQQELVTTKFNTYELHFL